MGEILDVIQNNSTAKESTLITCPECGCINYSKAKQIEDVTYVTACDGCGKKFQYRFTMVVASFHFTEQR